MNVIRPYIAIFLLILTGHTYMAMAQSEREEIKSADIYSEGLIDAMKNYMDIFGDTKADNADAIISKVLDTLTPLINDNEDIAHLYQEVLRRYAALALDKGNVNRWLELNKEDYLVTKQWYMKNPQKFAKNMQSAMITMTTCYIDEHRWDDAEKMANDAQMFLDRFEDLPEFKRLENQFLIDYYLSYIWSARGHLKNTLKFGRKALDEHIALEKSDGGKEHYSEERAYLEDEILAKCRTGR